MEYSFLYHVILPVAFLTLAALAFFASLKILLQRRPHIFPSRYTFIAMFILFIPMFANSIMLAISSPEITNVAVWFLPVVYSVLLVVMWIQRKGFTVNGVTDTYFREALFASTKSLGFTIEESLSRVKVNETGSEIEFALHSWIGAAQMKPLNKQSKADVVQVADEMNKYFQNHKGPMNYLIPALNLFLGGLFLSGAIFLIVLANL